MIKYVIGDLLDNDDKCVISHICNAQYGWGSGFVVPLARKYPDARADYLAMPELQLGMVGFSLNRNTIVANMIAQDGFKSHENPHPCSLSAVRTCLYKVNYLATLMGLPIHMPRIGCKLGGADWATEIEPIIQEMCTVPVVVFTLPHEVEDYPPANYEKMQVAEQKEDLRPDSRIIKV